MDISNVAVGGSFDENATALKKLGGTYQSLHLYWNQIEGTGSGASSGPFTDPSCGPGCGTLASMNAVATSLNIKFTLRIHPVDVPGKYLPADLMSTRFNNANLKTRAKAMLAFIFTKVNPAHVTRILIGNEVDKFNPGADASFWQDYPNFLFDINAWLRQNYPSLNVGFVTTLAGVTDPNTILPSSGNLKAVDIFKAWMGVVDLLGVTYYPLDPTFRMKPNSGVAKDFQNLAAFTTLPIHLEEVGYPTSATNGGSDNLQAEFFCEVLKAWDAYAARIPSLTILRLNDIPRSEAEGIAKTYSLSGNENFIEYIRSMGQRSEKGAAKSAYDMLLSELKKREF